jgi:hypothetical protein
VSRAGPTDPVDARPEARVAPGAAAPQGLGVPVEAVLVEDRVVRVLGGVRSRPGAAVRAVRGRLDPVGLAADRRLVVAVPRVRSRPG